MTKKNHCHCMSIERDRERARGQGERERGKQTIQVPLTPFAQYLSSLSFLLLSFAYGRQMTSTLSRKRKKENEQTCTYITHLLMGLAEQFIILKRRIPICLGCCLMLEYVHSAQAGQKWTLVVLLYIQTEVEQLMKSVHTGAPEISYLFRLEQRVHHLIFSERKRDQFIILTRDICRGE